MTQRRKKKQRKTKKKVAKKSKAKAAKTKTGKPPTTQQLARMSKEHARQIAQAEVTIKRTERVWNNLQAQTKEAKEQYEHSIDRLRKLAEEITQKGLFADKNRK